MRRTYPPAKLPPNRNRRIIVFAYANTSCGYPQDDDLSPTMNSYRIAAGTGGAKGEF